MLVYCSLRPVPTKIRCMWVCEFLYAILRMSVQNSCLFGCDECTCLHFCGDVLIVFPITYFRGKLFLCSQLHVSSIQWPKIRDASYTYIFSCTNTHTSQSDVWDFTHFYRCNLSPVSIQRILWSKIKFWCSCLLFASVLTGYIEFVQATQCNLCKSESTYTRAGLFRRTLAS